MDQGEFKGEESIDFNKLGLIFKINWPWIVALFLAVNFAAYLITRYTQNLYESVSEIKLDIKSDATELGITNLVHDPDANVMAGEIEIIKSKLFLNRVLDQVDLTITFFSEGRVLSEELFKTAPAFIKIESPNHSLYNVRIDFQEIDATSFRLSIPNTRTEVTGTYGEQVTLNNAKLVLERNANFRKGDEIGYYFFLRDREALLNYLVANLSAEPLKYNAKTIRLSFKDANPLKAQTILHKVDTLYLQYSNEQKNLANQQKIAWLSNELSQIESQMENYENYFEEFTLRNKTNNLDANLSATIVAINQIDSQRYQVTSRIQEADRFLNDLTNRKFTSLVPTRASMPESVVKNTEALLELQLQIERMQLAYNETSFAFRQKQNELDLLASKTSDQLQRLKKDWVSQLENLNKRKQALETEFADFPKKNTEFTKNQRFYKLYEEFYLSLMESKSQFQIAQAGTTPDFKILSPASFPSKAISPNRGIILGIGLVASIFINLFFIGVLYLINNKITGIKDLENIAGVPVLGSIPEAKSRMDPGFYIINHPKSMASEAIRTIRTNLDFFNSKTVQKVIAISSTVSGEGKSFFAVNLGAVLALSKKKVILLDLDMRKRKVDAFASDNDGSRGISTVLIRKNTWQECIIKTSLDSLDFIPAGPLPPNPSELLLNGEFIDLLDELRKHYDFIIMDTPPIGLVTDGIMAMRRADISIYIFRANYSKKQFILSLRRIVGLNKFSNVTTILNDLPSSGKTYGYGYYEESRGGIKSIFKS